MKKLSGAYQIIFGLCYGGGLLLIIIIFAGAMSMMRPDADEIDATALFLGVLGLVVLFMFVIAAITWLVFIYRMWEAIQPLQPRTTPGRAVGFLFIPFFNIYWVFVAVWGVAKDFNKAVERWQIPAPRVSEGLARAIPILSFLSGVPYIGWLCFFLDYILTVLFMGNVRNAVNALPPLPELAQAAGYPPGGGYPPGYPPPGSPPPSANT